MKTEMGRPSRRIRVMVVDDSALMRKMIPMIIGADEDMEVAGTAMDGDFALRKIPDLRPDVITLDVDMPNMDGLTTLRHIVMNFGIPVILVSSLTRDGADVTLRGLEMGAFDFVPKPNDAISLHISEISRELTDKIRAASRCGIRRFRENPKIVARQQRQPSAADAVTHISAPCIVAIGISTGGPQALSEILPQVPKDFPWGILIVQHMPEHFTDLFAKRLDSLCNIRVKEASEGDVVSPGTALIAPGGSHLKVRRTTFGTIAVLSRTPEVSGHRPSATVLFNSVAEEYGSRAVGIIMTGMGDDGAAGIEKIKNRGGTTWAQDEETSVIYGMPKAAVERGCIDQVLGLNEIIPGLVMLAGRKKMVDQQKADVVAS